MRRLATLNRLATGAVLMIALIGSASGRELAGVTLPDSDDTAGSRLVLNGMGLRTYSILRIRIYVAGLYLTHPSNDGTAILNSNQPKLLRFVFLHDVSAEAARKSWREALDRNCSAPCSLPPGSIDRFLAAVPAVHPGDTSTLLFTDGKASFTLNGRSLGQVSDADFTRTILATFVGPRPTSPQLKRRLLGGAD